MTATHYALHSSIFDVDREVWIDGKDMTNHRMIVGVRDDGMLFSASFYLGAMERTENTLRLVDNNLRESLLVDMRAPQESHLPLTEVRRADD